MVINHVGVLFEGKFEHWASLHMDYPVFSPENIRESSIMRTIPIDLRPGFLMHGPEQYKDRLPDDVYVWPTTKGTSSFFGTSVAVALGYDEITLAGIPMDTAGYFYGPPSPQNDFSNPHMREYWVENTPAWEGKVSSMSGWTRDLLGEPPCLR